MKRLNLFVVFLLITSCSIIQRDAWDSYKDLISTDMASFNTRLQGILLRDRQIEDLSALKNKDYKTYVKKYIDSSEKDYKEFLEDQDSSFEYLGKRRDFIVCIKNTKRSLVICDRASTNLRVDFISKDISIDLKVKTKELL